MLFLNISSQGQVSSTIKSSSTVALVMAQYRILRLLSLSAG